MYRTTCTVFVSCIRVHDRDVIRPRPLLILSVGGFCNVVRADCNVNIVCTVRVCVVQTATSSEFSKLVKGCRFLCIFSLPRGIPFQKLCRNSSHFLSTLPGVTKLENGLIRNFLDRDGGNH